MEDVNKVREEASFNKLESKKKSIEENYKIRVMKEEIKSSYKVSLIIN